jgi:predicted RNase H-like HicB family nuclease
MRYAVAVEPRNDRTAWGVVVPNLPGCTSAGDTLDEALAKAREAIEAWIAAVVEDGGAVPEPAPIELHYVNPDFAGWTWALVEIDPAHLDDTIERVNITLPRRVLARLDTLAQAMGDSRSGVIARLALQAQR